MNVLFLEDEHIFRAGFSILITNILPKANITQVATVKEAKDALDKINFELFISDLQIKDFKYNNTSAGTEAIEVARIKQPQCKILVLSSISGPGTLAHLKELSINGYLLKSSAQDEMAECLYQILSGQDYFDDDVHVHLKNTSPVGRITISKLQYECLQLIKLGKTHADIANELETTEGTIKKQIQVLLKVTKTNNTTELVAYSFQNMITIK